MFSNSLIQTGLGVSTVLNALVTVAAFSNSAIPQVSTPKLTAPTRPLEQQNCPLERSHYTAMSNPKFELAFLPLIKPAIASEIVSFSLKHKTRGTIITYNMGGSLGYGSLYLRDSATSREDDRGSDLKPVFFDANWRHAPLPLKTAPKYLFISGLSSNDWYTEGPNHRNLPLGEVMWQFSSCH